MLYDAAANNRRPQGMSIKQFIDQGLQFIQHLEAHHGIEETYVFPELAKKMPEFQAADKSHKAAELLLQHKQIHKGMDVFDKYLRDCARGEKDFEMRVLKEQMDTWADVLRTHLDQEVETLGAENMRKYYTLEEVRRLPM
jgi:hemerythrin-like domain-containing protein